MSLPAFRRRALGRIEQTLVAEDPGLGLRFAVFAKLTRHEAMPGTEQISGRLQRFLRPAIVLPLVLVSLVAILILAAGRLTPSEQACPADASPAARTLPSLSRAARCQHVPGNPARRDARALTAARTAPGPTPTGHARAGA